MARQRMTLAGWAMAAGAAMLAITIGCSSSNDALTRSQELVTALKKQNIPALPDTLTDEQAKSIDVARSGPGGWFVERGCFACHSVSVYGINAASQMGPDLSNAVADVQSRFGKTIDEFWAEPVGTMMMVRSGMIKLSPEEQAVGLEKLKAAFAEYQKRTTAAR